MRMYNGTLHYAVYDRKVGTFGGKPSQSTLRIHESRNMGPILKELSREESKAFRNEANQNLDRNHIESLLVTILGKRKRDRMTKLTRHNIDELLDNGRLEIAMRNGNYWKLRRNGATKTWKTDPNRIRVPVKAGLRVYDVISTYEKDLPVTGGHLLDSPYIRIIE